MPKKTKNVTLDALAGSIEDLARMTAKGFSDIYERMATKADIARLERGQESIILRLDNAANRFELVELQKRVKVLEHKAGIRNNA